MGCCNSRPAAASDDVPPNSTTLAPTSSRTAAPTSTLPQSQSISNLSTNSSPAHNTASTTLASTAQRPNKSLRPPSPVHRCPPERALSPWTPSRLAREREAFFDTRVTGDPAVWSALRMICDSVREGDMQAAQSLMDAVGLTCPTGRIKSEKPRGAARGDGERRKGAVFDESGRGYEIPGWVVSDPLDLAPEEEGGVEEKLGDSDWEDEEERRDEKGKSRAEDIGATVRVRARLSDRGTDVLVDVGDAQKVRVLVRRILEVSGEKSTGKRLRLFHLGKELSEEKSLKDQGWQEGHIVSAMVLGAPS